MSSSNDVEPSFDNRSSQYPVNGKVMIAAIVVLFVVVFFILSLHVYAKWFWRYSAALATHSPSRRRDRFSFTGLDAFTAGGNVGLDKAVIDSLPTFVYKAPPADEVVLECAVCLCNFDADELGRLLPKCNHRFHAECIEMWFHSHSTCPLCRTNAAAEVALQAGLDSSTEAASPWSLSQNLVGSQGPPDQRQLSLISDGLAAHSTDRALNDDEEGLHVHNQSVPYPTRVLFWGDRACVSSRLSTPSVGREFSYTRSLPRMAIDMQGRRTADAFAGARCLSLNLSGCPSTDDQACSLPCRQQLKPPPSVGVSIMRLLSRERKVFPSDHGSEEVGQDTAVSPV